MLVSTIDLRNYFLFLIIAHKIIFIMYKIKIEIIQRQFVLNNAQKYFEVIYNSFALILSTRY